MISKEEIKRLRKLHSFKGREETGLFLAEGEKAVSELLRSALEVKSVYYVKGHTNPGKEGGVEVTEADMARITQFHSPSPIAAVAVIPAPASVKGNRMLFLDRISDPGNAGTIIRLCHWFGIDTVLMSELSVDAWNPKLVQASMGSVFHTNIVQHVTVNDLKNLVAEKYELVGTHLKGSDIRQWKPDQKTVVVMGNESQGLSPEIEKYCKTLVRIPGSGSAESLNVAAATAIVLYEWNNRQA